MEELKDSEKLVAIGLGTLVFTLGFVLLAVFMVAMYHDGPLARLHISGDTSLPIWLPLVYVFVKLVTVFKVL